MTPRTDDGTRQWVLAERVTLLACLLGALGLQVVGVTWMFAWLIVLPFALIGVWLCDPRRSWWGNGPMAAMADPERGSDLRARRFRFGIVVVVLFTVLTAIVVFGGIAPAS